VFVGRIRGVATIRQLQMAANGRGVAKRIFLGCREEDVELDDLSAFVDLARMYPDSTL
jgi:hypothetical protein